MVLVLASHYIRLTELEIQVTGHLKLEEETTLTCSKTLRSDCLFLHAPGKDLRCSVMVGQVKVGS